MNQGPAVGGVVQADGAVIGVVGVFHFSDAVEVADEVYGIDPLSGFDGMAAELFDKADIVALMAPGLVHDGRIEGHSGQPDAGLQLHRADHPFGDVFVVSTIEETGVGGKVGVELVLRDVTVIAQIDLAEHIAAGMPDVTGHVQTHHDRGGIVRAGKPVPAEEPPLAVGEEQMLLPFRSRVIGRAGDVPGMPLAHGHEVGTLCNLIWQRLGLRTDLR